MRRALDVLYTASGVAAGLFLVAIAVLSLMQIGGRLLGFAAHSFDEFAGYCMAASSFLGLAYTYRANEHIRVSLLLQHVPHRLRVALEWLCLAAAVFMIGYFTWFTLDMLWFSYFTGDVSQGLVPIKLWIPQSGMALGLVILFVAIVDDIVASARGKPTSYERAEAAKAGHAGGPLFEK